MLNSTSAELDIIGNVCEILDQYVEFTNKHKKQQETKMIHILKVIETLIMMKKQSISTISLVYHQYMKNYKT